MNEPKLNYQKAEDMEVLHPDRQLLIGDPVREVTVREFRFVEGLRVHVMAKPIIDDMITMFDTTEISVDQLGELFARHEDAFVTMLAMSADVEPEFVQSLSDVDGQMLLFTFWRVNMLFFVRRLLARRKELQQARGNKSKQPGGEKSTPA